MPIVKQHLAQAQHNKALISSFNIDETVYLDWIVTVAFYTALHFVEAWFADLQRPEHFESHKQRQDAMGRVDEFKPIIYRLYRELEGYSRRTRYKCWMPTRDHVEKRILVDLEVLETEIRKLLDA